jgi:hypothetical protein
MIEFLGIFVVLFAYSMFSKPPIKDNPSIGESKIIDGIEYFNIGTLEDEDNWVKVGSVVIQYYVNVYEENDGYLVRIEKEMNENAYDYIECYDFAEAERRLVLMKQIYGRNEGDDLYNE